MVANKSFIFLMVLLALQIDVYPVTTRGCLKKAKAEGIRVNQNLDDCVVCNESLDPESLGIEGDRLVELECHHQFHLRCILPLFLNSKPCPLCRVAITKETAMVTPAGPGVTKLGHYTLKELSKAVRDNNSSYQKKFFSVLDCFVYRTEREETLLQWAVREGYDILISPIFDVVCERVATLYQDRRLQKLRLKEYLENRDNIRLSTVLHTAARRSNNLCLQELFLLMCSVTAKKIVSDRIALRDLFAIPDIDECNALLVAARGESLEVVSTLIDMIKWVAGSCADTRKALLNYYLLSTDDFASTPLHLAAASGNVQIAQKLFEAIKYGAGTLIEAQHQAISDFLNDFIDNDGNTLLHVAAKHNNHSMIHEIFQQACCAAGAGGIIKNKYLLDLLKSVNHDGFTPAQLAANHKSFLAFKVISDKIKQMNHSNILYEVKNYCLQRGPNQNSTLGIAAARGDVGIVKEHFNLLRDKIYSSYCIKLELVRYNALKRTGLHLAALHGHLDVVKELIDQLYDVTKNSIQVLQYIDTPDSYSKTAYDLAEERGFHDVVDFIDEKRREYSSQGISLQVA